MVKINTNELDGIRIEHKADSVKWCCTTSKNGLIIRPEKCFFGQETIDFLGHRVDASGIQPLPSKVRAIRDFPRPTTVRQLRRFIGMINFYHRFLPHAATTMKPLHDLCGGHPAGRIIDWSPPTLSAFDAARNLLSTATLLVHPLPGALLSLSTDASDTGIGGVLEQWQGGAWKPLAFFSRHLSPRERRYSAFDKELLAAYLTVRHFQAVIEGRQCILFTDHKPLVQAMTKEGDPWSARQQRQLSAIAEFISKIQHKSGTDNVVADCLSRASVDAVTLGVDYNALADAQTNCPETDALRSAVTGMQLQDVVFDRGGPSLLCDVSVGYPRPVVPPAWRLRVFDALHGLSHPGVRGTQDLIGRRYVWHGMRRDISAWCRTCTACQSSKVQQHVKAPVQPIIVPERAFSHVHVDIVGPLPLSRGYSYLLTVIDRTTRWPEALPLQNITADECARAFISGWVARYGSPLEITSDRGRQFISSLWSAMAASLGAQTHHTTAYHPQANGLVERFHRSLKTALRARLSSANWMDHLPWVLLGLRSTLKEDLGASPADMVFHHQPLLPGDFVCPPPHSPMHPVAQLPKHHASPAAVIPASLQRATHVFVRLDAHRSPLDRPYLGPYAVLQRTDKTLTLDVRGRSETVSIDRVKPAFLATDQSSFVTPPRPSSADASSSTTAPPPADDTPPPTPPLTSTRSGRVVRPVARFQGGSMCGVLSFP